MILCSFKSKIFPNNDAHKNKHLCQDASIS
jgi:hypothetical protein